MKNQSFVIKKGNNKASPNIIYKIGIYKFVLSIAYIYKITLFAFATWKNTETYKEEKNIKTTNKKPYNFFLRIKCR